MFTSFSKNRHAIALLLAVAVQSFFTCWAEAADGVSGKVATSKAPGELTADSLDARLDDLIEQLGSTQFTARRAAANEIRKIGPEAFDRLHRRRKAPIRKSRPARITCCGKLPSAGRATTTRRQFGN